MSFTIYAIAGDPGGAEALVPVLKALAERDGVCVVHGAYRQARDRWAAHGIEFDEIDEAVTIENCQDLIRQAGAHFLLTATSMNGIDLEIRFISAARKLKVPSLALLDFWSNYRERFSGAAGELDFLPDCIAIMDTVAIKDMMLAGFPEKILRITGQPAFDHLSNWAEQNRATLRKDLRSVRGDKKGDYVILFASQPLAEFYGEDPEADGYLGFTQHTVLPSVLDALEQLAVRERCSIKLYIRPHPRERPEGYKKYKGSQHLSVEVSQLGEPKEAALAAELVIGMNTVLLVEAAIMGCRVLSIQPDLRGDDFLPFQRWGGATSVYDAEKIGPTLKDLFDERDKPNKRAHFENPECATKKIIDLIAELGSLEKRSCASKINTER